MFKIHVEEKCSSRSISNNLRSTVANKVTESRHSIPCKNAQWRVWSDCAGAQADRSHRWSTCHIVGNAVRRLNYWPVKWWLVTIVFQGGVDKRRAMNRLSTHVYYIRYLSVATSYQRRHLLQTATVEQLNVFECAERKHPVNCRGLFKTVSA